MPLQTWGVLEQSEKSWMHALFGRRITEPYILTCCSWSPLKAYHLCVNQKSVNSIFKILVWHFYLCLWERSCRGQNLWPLTTFFFARFWVRILFCIPSSVLIAFYVCSTAVSQPPCLNGGSFAVPNRYICGKAYFGYGFESKQGCWPGFDDVAEGLIFLVEISTRLIKSAETSYWPFLNYFLASVNSLSGQFVSTFCWERRSPLSESISDLLITQNSTPASP